jgi:hypothetical protein
VFIELIRSGTVRSFFLKEQAWGPLITTRGLLSLSPNYMLLLSRNFGIGHSRRMSTDHSPWRQRNAAVSGLWGAPSTGVLERYLLARHERIITEASKCYAWKDFERHASFATHQPSRRRMLSWAASLSPFLSSPWYVQQKVLEAPALSSAKAVLCIEPIRWTRPRIFDMSTAHGPMESPVPRNGRDLCVFIV